MAKESSTGRESWRGERGRGTGSAPSRKETVARKWLGATILSLMLLGVVGVLAWLGTLFLFPRTPQPTFAPFLTAAYQKERIPPIAELQNERAEIQKAQIFPVVDTAEDPYGNATLDVMKTRLDNLARRPPGKGLVVYIAGYAMVNGAGEVQILAHDSDPYSAGTLLPLKAILSKIRDNPERHKLLVLDIMKPAPYPFDIGGTPDGVADLIQKELQQEKQPDTLLDPNLLVLVACAPGQIGLWSETMHESVFGHFFRAAFSEPRADNLNHNGFLSVKELTGYVQQEVSRWAARYRGASQVPTLLGNAEDFDLALVKQLEKPLAAKEEPPAKESANSKGAGESRAAAESKEGKAEKSGDEKEKKGAAKEDSGKAGEKPAGGSEATGPVYPDWLAAGWKLRQEWWKDNGNRDFQGAYSPRVFRKLEAFLLRAERQWRGGRDPQDLARSLSATVKALGDQMEADSKISRPAPPRSVGQAKAFGWRADNELVSRLRNLIETHRTNRPAGDAKAAEAAGAAEKKGIEEILTAIKAKPEPAVALAGTIVDATHEQRLDPGTVLFLDGLVTESKLGRNIEELRVLNDLAERAGSPGPQGWSEETIGQAWNMIGLAEQAASRPRTYPWVRGVLDQAQSSRRTGQALLLSQAREFVPWERIRAVCEPTVKDLLFILAVQDKIEDGQTALNRTRALLHAYLPFLHAARRSDLDSVWLAAAEAAVTMDRQMERPARTGDGGTPMSREELESWSGDLTGALDALRSTRAQLDRPFQSQAVQDLLRQAESAPESRTAVEIEALLTTPFMSVDDRIAVWKAGRQLEKRLGELPAPNVPASDPTSEGRRAEVARAQVARRGTRLVGLLRLTASDAMASDLGGAVKLINALNALDPTSNKSKAAQESALAQNWAQLAKIAGLVNDQLLRMVEQQGRITGDDRIGWVAPAAMLNANSDRTRQLREREALANWVWLAAHYRQQARDLHETTEPEQFYENAAQDCPGAAGTAARASVALSVADAAPTLSASQPQATVSVKVDAGASLVDGPQKIRLKAIHVDDPRLNVQFQDAPEVDLSPQNPSGLVPISVEWDETRGRPDTAPPKGFLVQAQMPDNRTFHALVPVRFEWRAVYPKLALSSTRDRLTEVVPDRFTLRTLPGRQSFTVFLINPSPTTAREVFVDILAGDKLVASSGEKPLPLPARSTIPVPSFVSASPGAQPPKDGTPLEQASGDLRIRLRDAQPPGQEFAVLKLTPAIGSPSTFVETTLVQFRPGAGGQNQLKVVLRALPRMTGPPCPVELVFPRDKELFPSLQEVPAGKLSGMLEPDKELTLTADAIKLGLGGSESGVFHLNIDGIPRAMWFRANFPQEGRTQTATEETSPPRVRFTTERLVKPNHPAELRVRFQVDKAPANATLAFNLGATIDGKFVPDISFLNRTPKKQHIGFSPLGPEGSLLFEASVADWEDVYPVPRIRGKRWAQAFLLGTRPEPLAESGIVEVLLDDLPPRIVGLSVPTQVLEGTPYLDVTCTLIPSVSRVVSVDFVTDTKTAAEADFAKADDAGKLVKGRKAQENDQRIWTARMPVPKDATGKLVVTARATNDVGLVEILGQALTITAKPAPVPPEEAAAKMAPKQGSIDGTVIESNVPRGGFIVYLLNPKEKDPEKGVKDSKTKDDGTFVFEKLEPGTYTLYCQNPESKRMFRKAVTVTAGEATHEKVELFLP